MLQESEEKKQKALRIANVFRWLLPGALALVPTLLRRSDLFMPVPSTLQC